HCVALTSPSGVDAQQLADSLIRNGRTHNQSIDVVTGNTGVGQGIVEGLDRVSVGVMRLLTVTYTSVITDIVGLADANDGGYFRQVHSKTPSARSAAIRSGA